MRVSLQVQVGEKDNGLLASGLGYSNVATASISQALERMHDITLHLHDEGVGEI